MAKNDDPNSDMKAICIYLASAALFIYIIWFFFEEQIKSGIRWLKIGELWLIGHFLNGEEKQFVLEKREEYIQFQEFFSSLSGGELEQAYQQYGHVVIEPMSLVSHYLLLPIPAMLALMGLYIVIVGPKKSYMRTFNMDTLLDEQAKAFPIVSPMTKFNPVKGSSRQLGGAVPTILPMMAEALSPEEWLSYYAVTLIDGKLNKSEAKKAFQRQLVARWRGANALPLHLKALFVAFSMKVAGQREEADAFLGEIAKCWSPKTGLRLTAKLKKEISNGIKDPKIGRVTDKVAAQHAFVAPAMIRILQMAREQGGVLAPSSFLWLRAVDRTMWYPLNNLGRGSFHMEALGAMAHFKAEKSANRPIPTPQIDTAIEGLQEYLDNLTQINIPPRDYSDAKKGSKVA